MGPDKNPELFRAHAMPRVEALDEEFERRMLLSQSLAELSTLFEEKDNTSHPVTEPTLYSRLYALSRLQRTQLSISGFHGMEGVNLSRGIGDISAKVAPHHDEFRKEGNGGGARVYRTRVIQITMPESGYGVPNENIEIFGINFYQPEPVFENDTESPEAKDPGAQGYLAIVGKDRKVQRKPQPITDETVVIAVRNKETNDAKLYAASFLAPEDRKSNTFDAAEIMHEAINEAVVVLPDQTQVLVKALSGKELLQAVAELSSSIEVLKKISNIDGELSEEEQAAVTATLAIREET